MKVGLRKGPLRRKNKRKLTVCGIVGYVGPRNAIPVLISGLEKLEYRGYDSAGVATVQGGAFEVFRSEGKLGRLRDILAGKGKLSKETVSGFSIGIGHTRWATHGRPTETNAHPHVAGEICVVHNGIIENYISLRERLIKEGRKFASETDTEIAAHLINSHLHSKGSLLEAVRAAVGELEGSYALVVISSREPDKIVVAKNSTPVIIGLSAGEVFVASDIPAILEYTRQVIILEDGDLAEVSPEKITIEHNGEPVKRAPITVTWDAVTAEKGGFRHFMLKEIHEQPQVITDCFRGRIDQQNMSIFLDDLSLTEKESREIERVCIVACGTAWHAALVTKFYLEKLAGIHVDVDYGSEFRYRTPLLDKRTLFIPISQSGETADTLGSLNVAAECGARTLAICNVVGSSITRRAENVLYTHAGPEISVASTKAFIAQVVGGYLLALHFGRLRGVIQADDLRTRIEQLIHLPNAIRDALGLSGEIEGLAKKYAKCEHFLFLGRGILYPIALEGALKLKEVSYVHAEGYPAGEMKHGPIALVNEDTPVVAVIGHDGVNYEKTMSNLLEVKSRGARIIAITDRETPAMRDAASEIVAVGDISATVLPVVLTIPLQLFAYFVAVERGTDVDQPRNLAKSVTVE